jgi:hypothetical protein
MHSLPLRVQNDPNDDRAVQVFVDTVADGVALHMLLDSGGHRTTVPHRDADDAQVPTPPVRPDRRDARFTRLDTLQWGSLIERGLVVGVDPPGWPHPPRLGIDVLGAHACHFRFSNGVLELDGPAPPHPQFPSSRDEPQQTPSLPAQWPGATAEVVWDTGAGITIVNRSWADAHPSIVTIADEYGTGTDVEGRTGRNPKGRLAPCRIGNVTFSEQACGVAPLSGALSDVAMIVGLPLISQADWYFDFLALTWTNHSE